MEPRNRCQGINSASLYSLAGRYENPIPPRCLAPIDFLKIPAQTTARLPFASCVIQVRGTITDEATRSPSILENVSFTTAILKFGSFIPQNVFALAEEAFHGGTGRHRRVVLHKKFGQNWLKDIKFKSNLYVAWVPNNRSLFRCLFPSICHLVQTYT